MIKFFVYIMVGLLILVMFFAPARNYVNNLFRRSGKELQKEQIAQSVPDYNYRIEEIQEALEKAGFKPGPIDGVMGSQTRAAIREFQKANDLKPDGIVGKRTAKKLNKYLP